MLRIFRAIKKNPVKVGGACFCTVGLLPLYSPSNFAYAHPNPKKKLMQLDTRDYEITMSPEELELSSATLCKAVERCMSPLRLQEFGNFMSQMGIYDIPTIVGLYNMFTEAKSGCPASHLELAYWCTKLAEGSMTKKLNFAFTTCDSHKNGEITRRELAHFLTILFVAHGAVKAGIPGSSESLVAYGSLGASLVDDIFTEADISQSGTISSEEFHLWAESKDRTATALLITKILDEWLKHSVALLY